MICFLGFGIYLFPLLFFFLQNLRQTLDDLTRNGYSVVSAMTSMAVNIIVNNILYQKCIMGLNAF